ncbi:Aspartate--ammonia ligase, partial [Clarias magur]
VYTLIYSVTPFAPNIIHYTHTHPESLSSFPHKVFITAMSSQDEPCSALAVFRMHVPFNGDAAYTEDPLLTSADKTPRTRCADTPWQKTSEDEKHPKSRGEKHTQKKTLLCSHNRRDT